MRIHDLSPIRKLRTAEEPSGGDLTADVRGGVTVAHQLGVVIDHCSVTV
jgi:hypothetical protein